MAPYILAEEKDLVALPDELSYTDGAQVACGFGTVYEGLEKIGIRRSLGCGLGPSWPCSSHACEVNGC
jgi:D-arabinose 1-dehydrogenase-like Zn-dependent alcohol dehydrogenase